MGKRRYFIILFVALVLIIGFFIQKHSIVFVYNSPNVEISSIQKISAIVKQLDDGFKWAKRSSHVKYLYQNAYGSGFLKNNPIPNDLDYAIGVNLGTFEYNGKNSKEIAKVITEKISDFQYNFIYYISIQRDTNMYLLSGPLDALNKQNAMKKTMISDISEYLESAIHSDSQYIRYTTKTENNITVDMPYVMKSGEILLQNMFPIIMYSDKVLYNSDMADYLREISVIPEYYFTLVKDSVEYKIEIVPESFLGARLQISRRFFAPAVFVNNYSANFLKKVPYIKDDDTYLYLRMLSFSRHLMEVKNIKNTNVQPVKLLKRIMQCADIIKPILSDSEYKEISDFVLENLNNNEIKLLNEYNNICSNIFNITQSKVLYNKLILNGEMERLYNLATKILNDIEPSICEKDKEYFNSLKKFHITKLKSVVEGNYDLDKIYDDSYTELSVKTGSYMYNLFKNSAKIDKFIGLYNDIYEKSGYKPVNIYWLDKNTIGILKDKNTEKIADLAGFAKENDLPKVQYKFVTESEIPELTLKHTLWLRYATTKVEDEYYNVFRQKLLNDRVNFKLRRKFVLF